MLSEIPDLPDLDGWLAERETRAGGVRDRCAKQVVWATKPRRAPISLVYVHGFSATAGEVRPLPDLVAKALGANLYFARLTGHGQDGTAMGRASVRDWDADVEEAFALGRRLGERVIVMGCSTGCTLITAALARGAAADGVVHLSPNFGLRNRAAQSLLQMPGVRRWGPYLVGRERSFAPRSDDHAAMWTLRYDTQAVFTMAEAVREALACPIEAVKTPAYFAYGATDRVVSPARTRKVVSRWGGPVLEDKLIQGPEDDKDGHVMAGDVLSPRQTTPLAERIVAWARGL